MAEAQPNIQAILAALAAQSGNSATPSQGQAPAPYVIPGYQQGPAPNAYGAMPPSVPSQAPTYPGYPVDLNAIRPVTSGTMNLGDLDRPDARTAPPRHFRSRSRSPPRRDVRDNVNPYRDERRNDRGTHVRDYGRDRERSESPDNSEVIDVESTLVGLVIGRQGENLRRIESETSCRVQFLSSTGEQEAYRQCKITGPRARRAEAKAAINKTIDDSGMGAIARAGLDRQPHARREVRTPNPNALRDGEDYEQIVVPDRTVGLIIGRGGETIRDLQERSGCHINIVGEDQSNNGLRPVNLIGPSKATALAKTMIMEIVDSDNHSNDNNNNAKQPRQQRPDHSRPDNGQGGPDKVNDSIYVPSEAVGMIIGKGGETIREMQNTTGCKINVTASSGPSEVQREIGLVGSRDAINRAKRAIEDKVDTVRQKNNGAGQGGRGGRNQHRRDWDSPSYPQQAAQAADPAAGAANGAADPYAPYGGYQRYLALWYQSIAQQGQSQGEQPQS
ncbi:hypothetical protein F4805DRAFT_356377 [Annulohypoxylon moriforme]|nr:hypothetical protein F4805DRAFT_356377 [Annulohypoxylon moriforme]